MLSETSPLERALGPLDELRRRVLLAAQALPWLGPVLAQRDRRILTQTLAGVSVTFGLTLLAPGALLVLGPLLFGVAHVASDVRYLVLRREVPRLWAGLVAAACGLLLLCRLVECAAPDSLPFAALEVGIGWGWALLGAGVGALLARSWARLLLVAPLFGYLLVEALARPALARSGFAYGHNLVALVLWVVIFRRRPLFALPVLVLVALLAGALLSGALLPWVQLSGSWNDRVITESLAALPLGTPQRLALGVGLSFVFLQAVHYAVWLGWVPQEDIAAEGTLSFRMSLRAMTRDFGRAGLGLLAGLVLLVLFGALLSPHRTRALYLSFAGFHGYLEVATLAFLLARGARPRRAGGAR